MAAFRSYPRAAALALVLVLALGCAPRAWTSPPQRHVIGPAGTHPVEGFWRMAPDGALIAIEPGVGPDAYILRVIDSPDYTVPSGAVLGTMTATATPLVFDASICHRSGASGGASHTFFVTIDPGRHRLVMEPYDARPKVSLRRWLPYFFRIIYHQGRRPAGNDGAVRPGFESPVAL